MFLVCVFVLCVCFKGIKLTIRPSFIANFTLPTIADIGKAFPISLCAAPNVSVGLVGKVQKGGRKKEGRVEKKARAARPPGPGVEPGTCRVLGEGPQLHAMGVV